MKLVVLVDGGFRGALGVHHGGVICGTRRPVIKDISVRRFLRPRAACASTVLWLGRPDRLAGRDLVGSREASGWGSMAARRCRQTFGGGCGSPSAGRVRRNWPCP